MTTHTLQSPPQSPRRRHQPAAHSAPSSPANGHKSAAVERWLREMPLPPGIHNTIAVDTEIAAHGTSSSGKRATSSSRRASRVINGAEPVRPETRRNSSFPLIQIPNRPSMDAKRNSFHGGKSVAKLSLDLTNPRSAPMAAELHTRRSKQSKSASTSPQRPVSQSFAPRAPGRSAARASMILTELSEAEKDATQEKYFPNGERSVLAGLSAVAEERGYESSGTESDIDAEDSENEATLRTERSDLIIAPAIKDADRGSLASSTLDAQQLLGTEFAASVASSTGTDRLNTAVNMSERGNESFSATNATLLARPPPPAVPYHRDSLVPSIRSGISSDAESVVDNDDSMSDSGSLSSSAPLPNLLQLHRHRLKKTEDPATQFLSATFIIDHVHSLTPATAQKPYCELAVKQLKKLALASNPYAPAQHLLANLYISGIPGFQSTHTPSYSKAFQLYSSASKRDHVESIFHLGLCYEMGLGTPQSNSRALWNYRKAAVSNHPGAMFRLGTSLLYGSLGQAANPRDGVKWLKLAAKYATPQYPHALYELGMLHEKGVENVIWPDWNYLLQLLSKGAELGCVRCQRKLGEAFEYGALGCEVDPGRSVYYFGLAAEGGDLDAMFELGGWYLTGVHDPKTGFTLAQSYTEAHRWVLRAAEGGSRRAMKAMGYFREVGVGCDVSEVEARWWYNKAANTPDDPIDKDDAGGLLGKVSRLAAQDGKKPAKTKQNASKRAMPAAKIAKKKSGDGKKSCVIM